MWKRLKQRPGHIGRAQSSQHQEVCLRWPVLLLLQTTQSGFPPLLGIRKWVRRTCSGTAVAAAAVRVDRGTPRGHSTRLRRPSITALRNCKKVMSVAVFFWNATRALETHNSVRWWNSTRLPPTMAMRELVVRHKLVTLVHATHLGIVVPYALRLSDETMSSWNISIPHGYLSGLGNMNGGHEVYLFLVEPGHSKQLSLPPVPSVICFLHFLLHDWRKSSSVDPYCAHCAKFFLYEFHEEVWRRIAVKVGFFVSSGVEEPIRNIAAVSFSENKRLHSPFGWLRW